MSRVPSGNYRVQTLRARLIGPLAAGRVRRRRGAASVQQHEYLRGGRRSSTCILFIDNSCAAQTRPHAAQASRRACAHASAPSRTASSHTAGPRSEASAKAKFRNCPRHRRDDRAALGAPLLGRRKRAHTRTGPNNASTRWRQKPAATHKKLWNTITRRLHDKITSSSPRPTCRKSAEPRTTAWSPRR